MMKNLPRRLTSATMLLLLVLIVPALLACGGDNAPRTTGAPTATTASGPGSTSPTSSIVVDDVTSTPGDVDASPTTGTTGALPTTAGSGTAGTDTFGPFTDEDLLFGKAIEAPEHEGGVLVQGAAQDVSTLLPVVTQDGPSSVVQGYIFESLVSVHPDTLEPIGLLAESWDVNGDASLYTFHLRDGITWSDGEPFTAADVEFTYLTHMTPETGSPNLSNLSAQIDNIDVLDPRTVQFTLTGTFPDFAVDIMVFNIIAKHIWEEVDPAAMQHDTGATGADPLRVVGTGPFTFDEWVTGDHLTLGRNANYWRGAPVLDTLIFKVLPDNATAVNQLKTGEIDWGSVPPSAVGEFDGNQDIAIIDSPTLEFIFYGLNLDASTTTLFQDVEVRQALLHALDREAMLDSILFGYGEVAVGTIPTMSWAYDPDGIESKYPYDPEMAKKLLDDAGWVAGADGVREKDGQRLAFTMYTSTGDQVRESYLTVLQEYWAEIDVEMTPQFEPFPVLIERLTETSDFEAFLVGFTWWAAVDQSIMFTCNAAGGNGFNFTSYCNPEVDAILSEALSETDRDRRIQLYTEFQNIVMKDLPETILFFSRNIDGVSRRVHNLFPNGVNVLFNAHTWWVGD